MIEPIEDMPAGVLGFRAEGEVTADDYRDVFRPAVDAAVRAGGKVRLLYLLGSEFHDYQGGALIEDAKLGGAHPFSFERCALVTDAGWAGPAMRAISAIWPGTFRAFGPEELDAAKAWLAE